VNRPPKIAESTALTVIDAVHGRRASLVKDRPGPWARKGPGTWHGGRDPDAGEHGDQADDQCAMRASHAHSHIATANNGQAPAMPLRL
jgi:hypothetical protein